MFRNRMESGRTMLEMITVISIMGLLTVGPILAFRQASLKADVNNLLTEVRKRALLKGASPQHRHATHALTEGLFDKTDGVALVGEYAIGDTTQEGFQITYGTRTCYESKGKNNAKKSVTCNVAYVPVGKYAPEGGTVVGKRLSKDMCQALFKHKVTGISHLGDVLVFASTSTGTSVTQTNCAKKDVIWIGVKIQ